MAVNFEELLDKNLNYKLLLYPDLYFGEAYTDGSLVIENGTLTEFLEIALRNIGRKDINIYGKNIFMALCLHFKSTDYYYVWHYTYPKVSM